MRQGWAANMTFPPLLFPDSITHLSLDLDNGISGKLQKKPGCHHLSAHIGTTMGLVQSLRQLQHLQVTCCVSYGDPPEVATESEAWRIQPLLTFLGSLPARIGARLPELTITFASSELPDDRGDAYDVNRECFLDSVVGCRELTDTIRMLSALRLLSVQIYENDLSEYDKKWWRAEIVTRLHVHLPAVINVIVTGRQSAHFCPVLR